MWLGNAEIGRHPRIEKAGALQFVDAGKISRGVEAEMRQERLRRAVSDRSAGRAAATAYAHPFGFEEQVQRAFAGGDAADRLDVGPRHRLVIGDDRQRLEGGARELLLLDGIAAEQKGEIGGGAEAPLAGDLDEIDTMIGAARL